MFGRLATEDEVRVYFGYLPQIPLGLIHNPEEESAVEFQQWLSDDPLDDDALSA